MSIWGIGVSTQQRESKSTQDPRTIPTKGSRVVRAYFTVNSNSSYSRILVLFWH